MLEHPPGIDALASFDKFRNLARQAGRDPSEIGFEVWMSVVGEPDQWREEVRFWKQAGVTHITCNNSYARYHHKRISGKSLSAHVDGLQKFIEAVRDEL